MRPPQEIWETALGELQVQVSKPNYETWLKDTTGLSYSHSCFTIGVPTAFVGEWLTKHLQSLITKTLVNIVGAETAVRFLVYNHKQSLSSQLAAHQTDGGTCQLLAKPQPTSINSKYTFDNLVVGNCNRLAYSAALDISEKTTHEYNPLFIHGGTGLGKTHLLYAIGHAAAESGLKAICVTAEQFTNEMVKAIREERTEEFQNRFRNAQALLVDDIHFISGKRQVQESFLHVFNELHAKSAQIVVTGDHNPKSIPMLSSRLRSRLEWGLVVEMQSPDPETRLAILKLKAQERELQVPEAALQLLASQIQGGVRELEGALHQVVACARLARANIDELFVREILRHLIAPEGQALSPKAIKQVVACYFGLEPELLTGAKKDQATSLARQVAMYLMRKEGDYSLSQISQEFGGRKHSTILYSCQKIEGQLKDNTKLQSQLNEINQALKPPQ